MPAPDVNAPDKSAPFPCPLCGTVLPPGATECSNCDWVKGYRHPSLVTSGTSRDVIAAALSIIPGAGHIFKGHVEMGIAYMVGMFVALFFIGVVWLVSMGFNLLVLPFYWIWVAIHAYLISDLRAVDHVPDRIG